MCTVALAYLFPRSPISPGLGCSHVHYYNRYMPYDAVTGDVDTASISADGSVYSSPKYMVSH